YRALDRIYVATSQWNELSPVIQRELGLVPPGDTAAIVDLKFRLGQLREQHLGDVTGAIEMYRDILDLDATHGGARSALEKRLAAINESWPQSVALDESAIEKLKPDGIEGPLLRELLIKVAEAYDEKLEKPEKATEYFRRAQGIDPDDLTAIEALERLYTRNE